MRELLPALSILCSALWIASCAETGQSGIDRGSKQSQLRTEERDSFKEEPRQAASEHLFAPETTDVASALVAIIATGSLVPCDQTDNTGVIVHPNGYIVTTASALEAIKGSIIKICLQNQIRTNATIAGEDPLTDLAILKIAATDLPYLGWADPDSVKVGDSAVIVKPHRPTQTVTVTKVSVDDLGLTNYENYIEVVGPFRNVGFSGALVNMKGQLIGINAAYDSSKEATGYAISSDLAVQISDRLIKHGKVRRGWTGVAIQNLTPELSKFFDTKTQDGVLVSDVNEYGAAYEAGLRRGDVILEIDGKLIKKVSMYRLLISLKEVGSEVQVKGIRNGQPRTFYLHLKELPKQEDR